VRDVVVLIMNFSLGSNKGTQRPHSSDNIGNSLLAFIFWYTGDSKC
jgi:hypothetical protein